jgi:8-oxo-dGTP pyrophosphatase MutT (NUDIX family)
VLLIDDDERVLLFRSLDGGGRAFWYPPGGEVEDGETHEVAGVREVAEETGLVVEHVGPLFGFRRHVVDWGGTRYDVRERWHVRRCPVFDIDTSGFTPLESAGITEWRWFSRMALRSSAERLVPADLAAVVDRLLDDGAPDVPWQLAI